jgi:hypothetical protein
MQLLPLSKRIQFVLSPLSSCLNTTSLPHYGKRFNGASNLFNCPIVDITLAFVCFAIPDTNITRPPHYGERFINASNLFNCPTVDITLAFVCFAIPDTSM